MYFGLCFYLTNVHIVMPACPLLIKFCASGLCIVDNSVFTISAVILIVFIISGADVTEAPVVDVSCSAPVRNVKSDECLSPAERSDQRVKAGNLSTVKVCVMRCLLNYVNWSQSQQ